MQCDSKWSTKKLLMCAMRVEWNVKRCEISLGGNQEIRIHYHHTQKCNVPVPRQTWGILGCRVATAIVPRTLQCSTKIFASDVDTSRSFF